jgi:hypothetical protein
MDDDEHESLALMILEKVTKFHIKDYLNIFTEKLLEYNQEYQEQIYLHKQLLRD